MIADPTPIRPGMAPQARRAAGAGPGNRGWPTWLRRLLALLVSTIPWLVYGALLLSPYKMAWFLSENARLYDLLFAALLQTPFVAAVFLWARTKRYRVVGCVFVVVVFVSYQALTWSFSEGFNKVVKRQVWADGKDVLLVLNHGGAFTSRMSTNVVISEPVAWVLRRQTGLKSYRQAYARGFVVGPDGAVTVSTSTDPQHLVTERFSRGQLQRCLEQQLAWQSGDAWSECKPDL